MAPGRTGHRSASIAAIALLLLATAGQAQAETIAVAVYDVDGVDGSAGLLLAVEEGIMDHLFFAGQIVFDIDLVDIDADVRAAQAIVEARFGGADFLVLYGVSFQKIRSRGLFPASTAIKVYSTDAGTGIDAGSLSAADIPRFDELSPGEVSLALGEAAGEVALSRIREAEE